MKNDSFSATHEAILGRLEWTQYQNGKAHTYSKNEFEKAISLYSGIPIIYAQKHPSTGFRGRNINEVLDAVNGKLAGIVERAIINNMGSPKISSFLTITDQATDAKIDNGEISLSQGFWFSAPDIGTLTNIVPDHILLYDRLLGIPQGDPGAMIVNQGEPPEETAYFGFIEGAIMAENEKPSEMDTLALILKKNQEEFTGKVLEKETTILKLNQDIEAGKEQALKLNQALVSKDAEILKLNQELAAKTQEILDIETANFKANQDTFYAGLPAGIQDKFKERKAELYDEKTALKLNQEIAYALMKVPVFEKKEVAGTEEIKRNQDDENTAETVKAYESLRFTKTVIRDGN